MGNPVISIGVPFYGPMIGEWVTHMLQFVAVESKNHEIREIITAGSMTADHNRNIIAADFLKSDAEWLFWVDADTMPPIGALGRMLAHGKTLVSGLYYGKNPPHPTIAYVKYNGAYTPLSMERRWEKGEIIPADAVGMGCMLTHRSVFEDIQKNFTVLQLTGGGIIPVHNSDIIGDVETTEGPLHHEHDGKVYRGQMRVRARKPVLANLRFPFFMVDLQKTEDMFFFELAEKVGHKPWLDTSVECGHLRQVPYTGADYRNENGH